MKFIYIAGAYTQFMGRTFAFKKATEVTDRATIAALQKNTDFKRIDDDEQAKEQAPAAPKVLSTVAGRPVLTAKRR